ncbi:hypothetical protein Sru01_31700 [Sphaerisporangium rufum]|uniref:V8-like Glu-specific endopeptidase n=1 Tax=Sphaerisporangium rufum TaxID=1381558 RepID=A0A919R353_9ACTN|nr:hypothetical protein [Sphaerisporangium rufum]GII78188.1 hypothetical protein Sru01_31700 [Sphaerisporangium rufum]
MSRILPLIAAAALLTGLAPPGGRGTAPEAPGPGSGPRSSGVAGLAPRLAAAAVSRPASPWPSASGGVVAHAAAGSAAERRRVLAYWTPRRMSAALPAALPAGQPVGLPGLPSARVPLAAASRPPGAPAPAAAAAPAGRVKGARWTGGGAVTRTTGRVFLTMGGADYVCSAGAVRSANLDVVVTAGHCVKDGKGAWAANWTFVPGYEAGRRPHGVFTARRMFVAEPWARRADDSYDIGMVAMNTSGGRHLGEAVGGQEIAFGGPRGRPAFGFGFPADPPYDGEHLIYCAGPVRGDPHEQTRDQGMRCDLTAGASGGPWLSSFDPATGEGVMTSVSSFKYSDDPATMYGPYFGDQARRVFEAAERA